MLHKLPKYLYLQDFYLVRSFQLSNDILIISCIFKIITTCIYIYTYSHNIASDQGTYITAKEVWQKTCAHRKFIGATRFLTFHLA